MNLQDCDYGRGMDGIVITREERTELRLRERKERDCDYDKVTDGTDGIVITTEKLGTL
jgi:hypothetical protein